MDAKGLCSYSICTNPRPICSTRFLGKRNLSMQRTSALIMVLSTVLAFLVVKYYVWSGFAGCIHKYPLLYQSIFPDASLYYVGLVILFILSALVSGICFVTSAVLIGVFIRDMLYR